MLAELGQVALILALLAALLQAALPLAGAQRGIGSWMALARPAACLQLAMVAPHSALLTAAFVQQELLVRYFSGTPTRCWPLSKPYSRCGRARRSLLYGR